MEGGVHEKEILTANRDVFTSNFWQSSTELQDDSSKGMLGSMSSLTLAVEEDEVKTTRFRLGFFLQDLSTFKVPSIAGFRISACSMHI